MMISVMEGTNEELYRVDAKLDNAMYDMARFIMDRPLKVVAQEINADRDLVVTVRATECEYSE